MGGEQYHRVNEHRNPDRSCKLWRSMSAQVLLYLLVCLPATREEDKDEEERDEQAKCPLEQ